ncbi:radical SAM protein [Desulforegula conservatrix]|uniref:radical SAM protein n=1 Tax=Desulforegula conservatrix TaxID=153026 RepID=UPI0004115DB0|nr:radical SAM protein [Desulforegula conservatrix]
MSNKHKIKTVRLLSTNECNLSCFYCCAEGHKSLYNHLNSANIKNIIGKLNLFFDIDRIKITGGEPLCSTDIENIIDSIYKTKKANQLVSIVTNGTMTEKLKKLLKYKDLDVAISLPSTNQEIFGLINRDGTIIDKVKQSIELLIQNNFSTKLNCVLVEGVTNTTENISAIINEYGSFHNVEIRFLELSINDINRNFFDYDKYKTDLDVFDVNMKTIGFEKCSQTEKRESVLYAKNGVRVKLIKFFCYDGCDNCPDDKTSIWVSCDGYISNCSFTSINEIEMSKFSPEVISNSIEKLLDQSFKNSGDTILN